MVAPLLMLPIPTWNHLPKVEPDKSTILLGLQHGQRIGQRHLCCEESSRGSRKELPRRKALKQTAPLLWQISQQARAHACACFCDKYPSVATLKRSGNTMCLNYAGSESLRVIWDKWVHTRTITMGDWNRRADQASGEGDPLVSRQKCRSEAPRGVTPSWGSWCRVLSHPV